MYSVSDETRKPIFEGVQGENEAREIQFDISTWIEELGDGACTATAKRPTDTTPYPVTVTRSGNVVTWKPNSVDTAIEGIGAFQLEYSINGSIAKTRIWNTKIAPSLDPAGDPPDPYDNWLAEMRQVAADAIQAADDAEESAQEAESYTLRAFITKTASGEVANFADGADDVPMKSVQVTITPKQSGSGDPSPTNVRTITGWTNVNVNVESANIIKTPYIGGASAYGVNFTKNDDGSVHVAGTPTHAISWVFDNSIKLKGGARYTFGYFGDMPNMNEWRLQVYSTQTATLYGFIRKSSPTLVIEPTKDDTVTVYFDTSSGMVGRAVDFTVQPVLAHGEMPAVYAPYTGHTTPVPLGQTVYGGEVDVNTGILTITKGGVVYNGSENWGAETQGGTTSFYIARQSDAQPVGQIQDGDVFTSICPVTIETWQAGKMRVTSGYYNFLLGSALGISTAEQFKTYLASNPISLCYKLATPTTVQLTPTQVASLLGTNNVWSDAGSVEVEYRADPTLAYNELANVIVSLGGNL